jgi:hypothetical protein
MSTLFKSKTAYVFSKQLFIDVHGGNRNGLPTWLDEADGQAVKVSENMAYGLIQKPKNMVVEPRECKEVGTC